MGLSCADYDSASFELSDKEKEVFLVLYTADQRVITYREIASGMRESEFLVRTYVTSLIQKGVPIKKKYINGVAYMELSERFKELQAKKNVLKISQKTLRDLG